MPQRTYTWTDPEEIAKRAMSQMSGLEFLRAMRDGEIPHAPIMETMDFRVALVEEGRVAFRSTPQDLHYNPIGTVHGGFYGTLLDSCMSCAVHSTLPKGVMYTTLEFKTNVVRALTAEHGEISAEGWIVHRGRRIATSEGRITDAGGKIYAHGTATCMILEG